MPADPGTHWTSGAPKWAAILILGALATAAIGWSIGRDSGTWRTPNRASAQTIAPTQVLAAAQPPPASLAPHPTPLASAAPEQPNDPPPPAAPAIRKLININTAAQGELELLPGIGPALAKRILDYRTTKGPFKRIDELDNVKGIGPKILARLRPQVTVE